MTRGIVPFTSVTGQLWLEQDRKTGFVCNVPFGCKEPLGRFETPNLFPDETANLRTAKERGKLQSAADVELLEA